MNLLAIPLAVLIVALAMLSIRRKEILPPPFENEAAGLPIWNPNR